MSWPAGTPLLFALESSLLGDEVTLLVWDRGVESSIYNTPGRIVIETHLEEGRTMNADDVFRYGHLTVLGAVEGFPAEQWETPGVCGVWSAQDVIAHLASYELATGDAFAGILGEEPTETLGLMMSRGEAFNDSQVELRRGQSPEETLAEYTQAHERAAEKLARIPLEQRRQVGILSWYGAEYDLEDLITFMSYGHKREHSAQIAEFCCRLGDSAEG